MTSVHLTLCRCFSDPLELLRKIDRVERLRLVDDLVLDVAGALQWATSELELELKPLRRASTYADSPGIHHPIIGTQITQVVSLTNLMNRTSQGPRNIVGLCCCTRVLPRFEASSYKSTEARRSEIWWERARRTFPNV